MISGAELTRARKEHGYNQRLMADLLGVSQPMVSMMEKGSKPLTNKALDFISGGYIEITPAPTLAPPKKGDLVIKMPLKTKKMREVKMPVLGSLGLLGKSATHPLCLRCRNKCKQTNKIKILSCPQYEAKDAK
jgi:transcriptional regulator with XRE-family HTH domain